MGIVLSPSQPVSMTSTSNPQNHVGRRTAPPPSRRRASPPIIAATRTATAKAQPCHCHDAVPRAASSPLCHRPWCRRDAALFDPDMHPKSSSCFLATLELILSVCVFTAMQSKLLSLVFTMTKGMSSGLIFFLGFCFIFSFFLLYFFLFLFPCLGWINELLGLPFCYKI